MAKNALHLTKYAVENSLNYKFQAYQARFLQIATLVEGHQYV